MENQYKLVDFKKYCETCKHKNISEVEDPCNECLDNGGNLNSERPINYEEDKDEVK